MIEVNRITRASTGSAATAKRRVQDFFQKRARSVSTDAAGRAQIGPRQIYILPTGYGVLYGAALFLMLIGALNYENNIGLLFTFLFAGIGLAGMLHTWRNLVGLVVEMRDGAPVFCGQKASFPLLLRDPRPREHAGVRVTGPRLEACAEDLPVNQPRAMAARARAEVRGILKPGRFRIETRYPLGLFRAWSYVESDVGALVYPRPAAPGQKPSESPGYRPNPSGDRGIGADDFAGPRPYRPGDPPRRVDWKAYARERGLVSKQFGGDRAEELWFDWWQLPPLDPETRLSLLCRYVLDAARLNLHFGLRLPNLTLAPQQGERHKHRCLTALALFPETS